MRVTQAGFDEHCLFHSWHTENKGSRYAGPTYYKNGKLISEESDKYGPDVSVDFILDFMKRNREKPMFVYYPMALPHRPMVPTPDSKEWKEPNRRGEEDVRYFGDMVAYMDKLVGRLVSGVNKLGLSEDTLILFYSDNGTHLKVTSVMNGKQVQGGKATPLQTGIRVPLIASWPGEIKPGRTTADLVDASDFFPTLADLAQVKIPKQRQIDGISFAPTLYDQPGKKREWCFFWYDPRPGWDKNRFSRSIFALDHNYKLFSDGRLFDIRGEEMKESEIGKNLSSKKAQLAKSKLEQAIRKSMEGLLSKHALKEVDAYGNLLNEKD